MNFSTSPAMLLNAILVLGRRSHRVQLLPLIDIDQQPIRLFGRGVEAAIDDARERLRVARAIECGFLFEIRVDLGRTGVLGQSSKGVRKRAQRRLAGAERDNVPRPRLPLLAQRRKQAGEDKRRLAAARRANDRDKAVRAHLRDKLADRVVAAAEERRVLLPERLEAPVGANRGAKLGRCNRLAAKGGAKRGKAIGLLKDARSLAEIDPGQKLQKPSWRRRAARHQHRDHRKRRLASLADQREFALILLGVADAVLAEKDGDRAGTVDRVFKPRNPSKARSKLAAVIKGGQALGAQPTVQFRRAGFVAAGVADKYVVAPPPMTKA